MSEQIVIERAEFVGEDFETPVTAIDVGDRWRYRFDIVNTGAPIDITLSLLRSNLDVGAIDTIYVFEGGEWNDLGDPELAWGDVLPATDAVTAVTFAISGLAVTPGDCTVTVHIEHSVAT